MRQLWFAKWSWGRFTHLQIAGSPPEAFLG
jgi:hypothetical protein